MLQFPSVILSLWRWSEYCENNFYKMPYRQIWWRNTHFLTKNHEKMCSFTWICRFTLPTAEILSGKNARAWVSVAFYIYKNKWKLKNRKQKTLGAAKKAQPFQPNLGENGLVWLCYLAGNFQTACTIFFIFWRYIFWMISFRTYNPEMPAHFCHLIFQL